jgi:hypothetical protein
MRAIAPSMPPNACPRQGRRRPTPSFFRRRRQRYKNASVVERPPQCYSQRLKLLEGSSARGLTCHCADKAGYMCSSPLYIYRAVLLLLRQRRGAGLGKLQLARGRSKYFAAAPAHRQRALYGSEPREVGVVKPLSFPVQDTRSRATGISCFPCQTTTRNFLRFFAPPRLFLPLAPSI